MKSIATASAASHTHSQGNSLPLDGGGKVGGGRFFPFWLMLCLLFVSVCPALGESVSEVTCKEERLTVKAVDAPLLPLLRSIAEAAEIEIFVSKSVELSRVTIHIRQEPIEPALKRLLERFNHIMMYGEKGGKVVLSSINVLSHGESGAALKAVREVPAQPSTAKTSGPTAEGQRKPEGTPAPPSPGVAAAGSKGLFVPQSYEKAQDQGMSAVMAKNFENQERMAFNEIAAIKNEIRESRDPDEQAALNVVLMEKLREFENFQRANRNTVESLRRVELFNQMKNN